MPIKYLQSVLAAPTPAQKVRKAAKTKIDGLNKKIDQARDAKQGAPTVEKRAKQNQKIRDAHHQLDQVRNDRDKSVEQLNKGSK